MNINSPVIQQYVNFRYDAVQRSELSQCEIPKRSGIVMAVIWDSETQETDHSIRSAC